MTVPTTHNMARPDKTARVMMMTMSKEEGFAVTFVNMAVREGRRVVVVFEVGGSKAVRDGGVEVLGEWVSALGQRGPS